MATVSLVSMPTQVVPVSLTVWVFAFWYVSLANDVPSRLPWSRWVQRPVVWMVLWAVAVSFAAVSFRVGRAQLRSPHRALLADWDYYRGWYPLETPGNAPAFRWMAEDEAVAVFPEQGRYLKLTFWVNHPDAAGRPVDVSFFGQGSAIGTARLHDSTPVTWYVLAPSGPKPKYGGRRMMLEAHVSRTWRPRDSGIDDPRIE